MFLTNPTVEELQALDMTMLIDMLEYQTNLHVQLLKEEGLSNTARTCKECMINIQTVIKMKKKEARKTVQTGSDISFIRDATSAEPLPDNS